MAHKTLIGGTAYSIKGGKTLIGGTAYSIKKGKTLVGGTAYAISFAKYKYTTTTSTENFAIVSGSSQTTQATWYYSNGFTFDDQTGKFTLTDPSSTTIGYVNLYANAGKLVGKYAIKSSSSGTTMYKFASDGSYSKGRDTSPIVYYVYMTGGYTEYASVVL